MSELSPAARAVFDAINKELDEAPWDLTFIAGSAAAAALRAAVDQLTFRDSLAGDVINPRELLALADELEGK